MRKRRQRNERIQKQLWGEDQSLAFNGIFIKTIFEMAKVYVNQTRVWSSGLVARYLAKRKWDHFIGDMTPFSINIFLKSMLKC